MSPMTRNILLIVVCMLISDWANVLLKLGASQLSFTPTVSKIVAAATNPFVVGGFLLYGAGVLLWLTVLAQNRFGAVVVFFSIHYIHLMLLSRFVFKEPITWNMWAGALFIMVGVALFSATNILSQQP
jgi:drug/metabolite transporter (DMT)-like permease